MLIDLTGRTALVTGSTQGIGRAIASTLADAGARVAVNGRTAEIVDAVVSELAAEASGRALVAAPGDVTTQPGAASVLDAVGDVDILVNNLGIFGAADALEISDEEWRRYFDVNVLAAVRLIRATLPGMKARGWGRVLTIASDSAIVIPAEMIHYGMSKTALLAVSAAQGDVRTGPGCRDRRPNAHRREAFVYGSAIPPCPVTQDQAPGRRVALQRLIEPQEIANMRACPCPW